MVNPSIPPVAVHHGVTSLDLFWVVLLLLSNGVFVAAEFAMVRSHIARLRLPEMKRKYGVKAALKLLDDIDGNLSAMQLGITLASLLLGWWGEETFQRIFFPFFDMVPENLRLVASHAVATSLALVVITFLHVVLGELVAKSLAIRYPERTLRMVAGPVLIFSRVFQPIIKIFNGCSNAFLRLFGVRGSAAAERVHTSGELALLVSESTERGILDKDEEQMLHGVFTFSDTVAREVMTPRTDVITIPVNAALEQVMAIIAQSRFSRYPVTTGNVDNVLGVLLIRDLVPYLQKLRTTADGMNFDARRIMREPYFVPGTKKIDDLLNEFKKRKVHLAIVVDEHGGVDGVVTLEDLIEEIVGEIFDESDIPEKDIVIEGDGNILVDGGVLVSDINSRFQLSIPEGDYDTIAGFIYTSLGRIPRPGDRILVENGSIRLLNGDSAGVSDVTPKETAAEGEEDAESGAGTKPPEDTTPKAVITVENVTGPRIDRVRLKAIIPEQTFEPLGTGETSQSKENLPESEV